MFLNVSTLSERPWILSGLEAHTPAHCSACCENRLPGPSSVQSGFFLPAPPEVVKGVVFSGCFFWWESDFSKMYLVFTVVCTPSCACGFFPQSSLVTLLCLSGLCLGQHLIILQLQTRQQFFRRTCRPKCLQEKRPSAERRHLRGTSWWLPTASLDAEGPCPWEVAVPLCIL